MVPSNLQTGKGSAEHLECSCWANFSTSPQQNTRSRQSKIQKSNLRRQSWMTAAFESIMRMCALHFEGSMTTTMLRKCLSRSKQQPRTEGWMKFTNPCWRRPLDLGCRRVSNKRKPLFELCSAKESHSTLPFRVAVVRPSGSGTNGASIQNVTHGYS